MNPSDYRNMQDTITRLRVCRTDKAQSIARLKVENKSLTDALRKCVAVLEEVSNPIKNVNRMSEITEFLEERDAAINKAITLAKLLLNPNDTKP